MMNATDGLAAGVAVPDLLEECGPGRRISAGEWELHLEGTPVPVVSVRRNLGWLVFDGLIRTRRGQPIEPTPDQLLACLKCNAFLPDALKISLALLDRQLHLGAELLVDDGTGTTGRIHELGRRIRKLGEHLQLNDEGVPAVSETPPFTRPPADTIQARCAEAGWPVNLHAHGRAVIPLEVPGAVLSAEVRQRGDDSYVLAVETGRWPDLSAGCRQAVAVFLLALCRRLRMVRASAAERDGALTASLEAAVPVLGGASCWATALGALSTAAEACRLEVAALGNHELAGMYLQAQGWPVNEG